jgi:hypothetical protein
MSKFIEKREEHGVTHISVISRKILGQYWAKFISNTSFHWKWYGHFTFRDFPHPESANKIWMKWVHILNRKCHGNRYWNRKGSGITWVRSTEYQGRGSLHYHAIMGNLKNDIDRFEFMRIWEHFAGFARIYVYDRDGGAEDYLSKSSYVFKQGEIDISDTVESHLPEITIPSL